MVKDLTNDYTADDGGKEKYIFGCGLKEISDLLTC